LGGFRTPAPCLVQAAERDKRPVLHAFNVWNPTGPLSGVTTGAAIVWLVAWFALARTWGRRNVNLVRVNTAAFIMLIAGLPLTFPPFMDLLQGK
jgi:hypothetical protein